ncbi:helix-turn-helix domain-containing protein [archaeon]|jgi:ribosome-binding protein aMBF1 (putative translation factor)|nr:helix-turn-helix domain-containing protein [archaeon]
MARCAICKKTSDETKLFEGIFNAEMINICSYCAEDEGVPIITKPSEIQLEKADERYSVRERMERMSGRHDTTEISKDQIVTQGNLAKLRMPAPKEQHEDALDNYYWTLNIARRRKKLSVTQLAEKMQVDPQVIQDIEKGRLPEKFQDLFIKLEAYLGIKLLKGQTRKINFIRNYDAEKEILKRVGEKMGVQESVKDSVDDYHKDDIALKEQIAEGKIDFSKREKLQDVSLNDLVEMKKEREIKESKRRTSAQENAMIGDDLDLDLDEL